MRERALLGETATASSDPSPASSQGATLRSARVSSAAASSVEITKCAWIMGTRLEVYSRGSCGMIMGWLRTPSARKTNGTTA